MNLPNKLTLLRCALTPLFLACLVIDFPLHYGAALLVFIVASLTDYFDGLIARKRGQITNFGKFLDPLADKALTTAAFIGFVHMLSSQSQDYDVKNSWIAQLFGFLHGFDLQNLIFGL